MLRTCLLFYFTQHNIQVQGFPSYIHWFIKTVVTNLIPFKTYLCVVFFSFASCLGKLREISDVLTRIRLCSLWIFMTGFPLNKTLVATTPHLCRGRLRMKETCRFMSQVRPICPLAHIEVTNLPKAVAELDFQMKSTTRSTAKPFVMTCPSVSVPQNSRSADEKLAGHCACALSSGEKNKTDMSFRWTRGKGGLKGSWQGHAHTHTCRDTSDGSILWAPRAFSLILSTWPWASPPQTLSSPSRSVALFVIVIRPVFVKGSLAVCSRWWVYICACVCVYKSQPAEGVPWHHCRRVFCHTL